LPKPCKIPPTVVSRCGFALLDCQRVQGLPTWLASSTSRQLSILSAVFPSLAKFVSIQIRLHQVVSLLIPCTSSLTTTPRIRLSHSQAETAAACRLRPCSSTRHGAGRNRPTVSHALPGSVSSLRYLGGASGRVYGVGALGRAVPRLRLPEHGSRRRRGEPHSDEAWSRVCGGGSSWRRGGVSWVASGAGLAIVWRGAGAVPRRRAGCCGWPPPVGVRRGYGHQGVLGLLRVPGAGSHRH